MRSHAFRGTSGFYAVIFRARKNLGEYDFACLRQ